MTTVRDANAETAPGTCLLCHTINAAMTREQLAAGAYWRCRCCGQMWDAGRLATVAAYAEKFR